jgi:hypothetical protein
MDSERLRQVARGLFKSPKAGDDRTLGEKAIGLLAFQQLGGCCEIVSRADGARDSYVLRLERGRATATLERERRRAREFPGTTVYLSDLDPDVLRVLTRRKVVDYLRRRRAAALARGDYEIEVIEGRSSEVVTPDEPDGVRLALPGRHTLWGRIEFALYVAPEAERRRRVAVVGRAGTTIIDDVAQLDEFDRAPWTSDQVSGRVVFDALQQTAGRRAILRDRDAFPVFVDAVRGVEPVVAAAVERLAREVDAQVADRLNDTVRRIFSRVLRELADVDNPMRTPLGVDGGQGALLSPAATEGAPEALSGAEPPREPPEAPELDATQREPPLVDADSPAPAARPDRARAQPLPRVLPDPAPGAGRSRFDNEAGVVFYSERHPDYLLVKDDEATLLDYLSTLVAKEYVVYNNPRAPGDELAEEMVRMVVRVRRHLPRRYTR